MEETEYAVSIDDILWVAAESEEDAEEKARDKFIEHLQISQNVEVKVIE